MTNRVVNIISFVRALRPRPGSEPIDLLEPVRRQLALSRQLKLPVTWLLQYDALISGGFVELLREEMPPGHEVGIWFEVVQPNVEAAGITWRGRWPWDWHANVGFSVGYPPEERFRIADCFVAKFREVFGQSPRSMGSWFFDAPLLDYLHRRHGISAACNCREQYGTDGYTLWGGYWANGYYPSRRNSLMPAQRESEQIPVPVFRMLGSDPLYQYDAVATGNGQSVITLEPALRIPAEDGGGGGGDPAWTDWFFCENFRHPNGAMSYAQTGQENTFGWRKMSRGIQYQFVKLAQLRDCGALRVETLAQTGDWFRRNFTLTPVSSVVIREDWRGAGRAGVWYLSRFQRINLVRSAVKTLQIRDWHLFSDAYPEPYERRICTTPACAYLGLPIRDGLNWPGILEFSGGSGAINTVEEPAPECLMVDWHSDAGTMIRLEFRPDLLRVEFCGELIWDISSVPAGVIMVNSSRICFEFRGMCYELSVVTGRLESQPGELRLQPQDGVLLLQGTVIGSSEIAD